MDSRKQSFSGLRLATATNHKRRVSRSEPSLITLMEERKWEDLETDCLVNILERVGMESLLLDVPFVCKSWYKASLNPLCWGRLIFPNIEFDSWSYDPFTQRLMDVYGIDHHKFNITAFIKSIVNRSCKNATMLILPSYCTEEALKYVADDCPALRILGNYCSRCPAFRTLGLPYEFCDKQEHIMPELMVKWKNLEGLMLGCSYNLKEILAQISLHCKNFKEIRVENADINIEEASAIVTLLPNIKKLIVRAASIDREDLLTILQGCKELSHLDVSDCVGFEADDEILELASHIHTFKYEGSRLDDDYWLATYMPLYGVDKV